MTTVFVLLCGNISLSPVVKIYRCHLWQRLRPSAHEPQVVIMGQGKPLASRHPL